MIGEIVNPRRRQAAVAVVAVPNQKEVVFVVLIVKINTSITGAAP
jgi:hypothetical protein